MGTPQTRWRDTHQSGRPIHRDEPLRRGAKDDRLMTPPAMRIAVRVIFGEDQRPGIAQKIDDGPIRFKDVLPGEMLDFRSKTTGVIDRAIDFVFRDAEPRIDRRELLAILLADDEV